jgi:hypothetical protein
MANLVPIRSQTWLPKTIVVSDWLISKKIFFSKAALPNESKQELPAVAMFVNGLELN